MRLSRRLRDLELLHRPTRDMRGSHEVHCIGGWGRLEGERCEEHEQCVFQAIPLPGRLRRIVQFQWQEGITNLLE